MKHLDLFSGYGGFTISAQKLGWETIGFSEIDKYANAVLEYNFNIKNYGDITKIKGEDLPDVDIITGGSPCQDLSVAGKGAGLNGERSGLFFHFIRLIKEKQPTYFVWENVKGALSSSRGWDFARVQIEMEQAGYDVWWQLINAKDFGVPQNRERIFAIGIRKGSGREILFEQRESRQNINKIVDTGHDGTNIFGTDGIAPTQKALGGGQGAKTGLYAVAARNRGSGKQAEFNDTGNANSITSVQTDSMVAVIPRKRQIIVHNLQTRSPNRPNLLKNKNAGGSGHLQREDGVTYTVDTGCTQGVAVPMRWSRNEKGKQARREAQKNGKDYTPFNKGHRELTESREDVSGCITNALNKDSLLKQDMRIRRLTPLECERLMGLEDGEKCSIIRLWQGTAENSTTNRTNVSAAISNGRQVRLVGSVGKTEKSVNVESVENHSQLKSLNTKEPVALNVQVNSEKNSIRIWHGDNEEELLLSVGGAGKKGRFPNHSQIVGFVQLIAGLDTILQREIHSGEVESHLRGQSLIHQESGVPVLNMSGIEIMPPVKDVEKDLIILNEHLKSTILLDSRTKNYEQNIQTLFSSVIPVITGFTPIKIKIESISEIKLSVLSGWTSKGIIDGKEVDISDTQRYKMCGNGVVVSCVDYIYSLIKQ